MPNLASVPPLRLRLLVVFLLFSVFAWIGSADARDPQVESGDRRDTWAEAMVATRASHLASTGKPRNAKRKLSESWVRITSDFPAESRGFVKDLGRRHLDWFAQRSGSGLEEEVIRRATSRLGATRVEFQRRLKDLIASKAGNNDARWLALYAAACRGERCEMTLRRIWLLDLRRPLQQDLMALVATHPFPAARRWKTYQQKVNRIASAIPPGRTTDTSTFRDAITQLTPALPGRLNNSRLPLEQLNRQERIWHKVFAAVVAGTESSFVDLGIVCRQVQDLQESLLLSVDGMADFLTANASIDLRAEWETEHQTLLYDLRNRSHFQNIASETFRQDSRVLESDRDPTDIVIRRTVALLNDIRQDSPAAQVEAATNALEALQKANLAIDVNCPEARRVLFAVACRQRRRIALMNPLLNFDAILFIKRHRALFNHMCDQYYGMAATPGGGLYVLSQPFGPCPELRDVLAEAVVQPPGRLQGRRLTGGANVKPTVSFDGQGNRRGTEGTGGSFLSPDLSFDGTSILFAYVENAGDMLHRHHVDPSRGHWDEGRCYHVFSVNVDGSDLRQITEGSWNDFDPCWLPNGRMAFISERRGGYLRCGRVCPNYTLFDMKADGSDINCLSFHETNEWHPSVTNDGMIIWTRWDYVDRHGCTAHMPWLTSSDGRDPRAVHGNFAPRNVRPDMEVDCRAIPGSHKYLATAAPHHGQAFGSLVIIDPHVADDDAMGPVRRVTPEVSFPESQGGGQVYGTAWPLSEDYYLCVYDAAMQPGAGQQGGKLLRGNYGIYLVDSFGNRELVYRDPDIGCLSPIPVRPRPLPPLVSELANRGRGTNPTTRASEPDSAEQPTGTVAVMNVYDSLKPWPDDTAITALRVLQVFPMSVPSGRPPHETGLRVASAGDSVVPVRHVLGTVPVEEDGSAFFTVPANKELFFQALDENGLAVQSMRSATHVREGERLVCAGCHNPRHRASQTAKSVPKALLRPPSRLQDDVDGSKPFSYPRLVQPVLDRHCVACHAERADTAPNLARDPIHRNWYASYNSLIQKYGFHDYRDGYRTTPGQFGARASKLYQLLENGHYDVELSKEDMHRLTLWLDCTSMFYGVYEKEGGQIQLRGGLAFPTLE